MKINIKRAGGFMGLTSKASIDFNKMSDDERAKVEALMETAAAESSDAQTGHQADDSAQTQAAAKKNDVAGTSPEQNLSARTLTLASPEPVVNAASDELIPDQRHVHYNNTSQMRDGFEYSFSYKKGGKTIKYTFNDFNAPPHLIELFEKYCEY
jgi:hypothetical protein